MIYDGFMIKCLSYVIKSLSSVLLFKGIYSSILFTLQNA